MLVQQILAILLVFGLLAAMLTLVRRKSLTRSAGISRSGKPKQIRIVERVPLSPQHSLLLVSVRDSVYLIGTSPSGCSAIASFDDSGRSVELKEPA